MTESGSVIAGSAILVAAILAVLVVALLAAVFNSGSKAGAAVTRAQALTEVDRSEPDRSSAPTFGALNEHAPAEAVRDAAANKIFSLLNEYYVANIWQAKAIFSASLLAIVIGFAIVFIGITTARGEPAIIVTGIGGLLSQFIAATFLVVLRTTQQQSTAYAQTLVELRLRDIRAADDARATGLGLQLLHEISGDGAAALANQTRAALAMGLIVKTAPAPAAPVPAPVDINDAPRAAPVQQLRTRLQTVTSDDTAAAGERRAEP